jgi:GlpG protein
MRQIGTLSDGDAARALADYLLTLNIETRLQREAGGWEVWVCDEDRVPQARQELEAFTRNPADPRYAEAARAAEALRRRDARAEEAARRQQVDLGERLRRPAAAPGWTLALILASGAASLFSTTLFADTDGNFDPHNRLFNLLLLSPEHRPFGPPAAGLYEVRHGQVWRLVTPIFLHFGLLHLLFNMLMLYSLGGAVERQRGPARYLALVLVTAVVSNLMQFYFGFAWTEQGIRFGPTPVFGGMSGVLYGLFGYAWMKSRFEPWLGLWVSPNTVFILVGWLILCMTRASPVANVANTAHVAGLLVGLAVGYAPTLWRSLR